MTRTFLDQTISSLKQEILEIEKMVSIATTDAVAALIDKDLDKSKQVYLGDQAINAKRFTVENECLIVIATQQPLATDLRVLASILEIVTELERMGDYAKGIAKINMITKDSSHNLPIINRLKEMAEITVGLLHRAVEAFVAVDVDTSRSLPEEDDAVDAIFNEIYTGLVENMMEDRSLVAYANHMQWAAHNLERMSDRVTNICERTIFVGTGEMNELEESDDEWVIDIR
jgi:phosphate transport system protein